MNPNEQNQQPGLPQSNWPSTPTTPQPTTGTEHVPMVKRWLPRLTISAILINFVPILFSLFGENYRELGETIRMYAIGILVVGLLIIMLKILSENKNAKN